MRHTNELDIFNPEWYWCEPELKARTMKRIIEIKKCGMTEVAYAQFGVEGVVSGLYIEKVWRFSDEEFKDYMGWANSVIERKRK